MAYYPILLLELLIFGIQYIPYYAILHIRLEEELPLKNLEKSPVIPELSSSDGDKGGNSVNLFKSLLILIGREWVNYTLL